MAFEDPASSPDDERAERALRGSLLTSERLLDHAAALAAAHGPTGKVRLAPLPARFEQLREELREAYVTLARDVRAVREPSPSEEWLLDNAHVVDDQVREVATDLPRGYLVELPRLLQGPLRGFPRVYALCLDYVRHTDARVDPEQLIAYVRAYGAVQPLTIGELWAVPIMLRLGLLMIVTQLARTAAADDHAERARDWAEKLAGPDSAAALSSLARKRVSAPFLVELARKLHEHEAPSEAAMRWVHERAGALGDSIEELGRRYHLQRAADQLSVGNAITSMRTISAFMWPKFFQATSAVEAVLVRDPVGAYAASNDETRDRCRHAIERIARRSPCSESEVANAALALAIAAHDTRAAGAVDQARAHVGFYLIADGRLELERMCKTRPLLVERARRFVQRHATGLYLGVLVLLTALGVGASWHALAAFGAGPGLQALIALLLVCPISDAVLALINTIAVMVVPPRLLARLDFERGIPEAHRTLVVVPCLLDDATTVERLLAHLEVRALANSDDCLSYALLTDFADAASEQSEGDAELLELARRGIERLNQRHEAIAGRWPRFALLHRKRVWNPSERCFMGWERKRGKLDELNRLLRGRADTTFSLVSAPVELLHAVRYVITLDADTELPRGAAQKLVATLAHPLNRPHVDERLQRVTRGYGILQPRVGTTPRSTRRTRYARIMAGQLGIDPYTLAVSDVYQDLFGEGSFNGKGIYDVDAFARAIEGRVAENRVLSHDLLESLFARCALVSDIELLDEQPASYEAAARRQHRWTRGDWQLLPWAFGRASKLTTLGRFKLLDNLRRSLVAPTAIAALLCVAFALPVAAGWAVALLLCVLTAPLAVRLVTELVRSSTSASSSQFGAVWGGFWPSFKQCIVQGAFLLDETLLALDAVVRTLYRLAISKRRLLEWQSMNEAQRMLARTGMWIEPHLWLTSLLAALVLGALGLLAPAALLPVGPLLLVWLLGPLAASWLSKPLQVVDLRRALAPADLLELRALARRTWLFFETFVTAEDNFLPPDNYQEEPRGVVAHRTSPTNIGLYLLSVVAARDFGFITLDGLARRVGQTLDTLHRVERREGHILNWYDTTSLRPLEPKYVSTVDSGNLAAYLWTLKASCDELIARPVIGPELLAAIDDALRLASEEDGRPHDALRARLQVSVPDLAGGTRAVLVLLAELQVELRAWAAELPSSPWRERACVGLARACEELRALAPFALLPEPPPELLAEPWAERFLAVQAELERSRSLSEFAALADGAGAALAAWLAASADERPPAEAHAYLGELCERVVRGSEHAAALIERLGTEGARAQALADQMNFAFLFDQDRALFSIGYDVSAARLDGSYYDLLASEARLASLFAIAKGDVPEKHWFRLGRPLANAGDQRALLSWSGSMFEYLMPLLVTRNHPDTLLHETCESAVIAQRNYGREHDVPWGVSEAAYNVMDLSMTYQYRAFGVQALGLKAGLADDLVIAPYASVLAAQVRPDLALPNLRALARAGVLGELGCYEAIDYTKTRVPPGRTGVVVKAYFAHHQGMSLVALDNTVNDGPMVRRFHREPRMQATELLLEERVPQSAPVVRDRVLRSPAPMTVDTEIATVEHVGLSAIAQPRAHLLGHGEVATLVTACGTGFTRWRQLDVHRFREDAQLEPSGIFIYLRNLTKPATWSGGFEPVRSKPAYYDAAFAPHRVDIQRRDGEVETHLAITVSPEHAADVRRVTLVNHGTTACEIELTAYTEIVLAARAADCAHRAFSGMFVESEALPGGAALLATRRPRKSGDFQPWLTQVLAPESGAWSEPEYETSRAAFIGRGRSVQAPAALEPGARLSSSVSGALDPAFALRRTVRLAPGEHASIALSTALATTREQALDHAQLFSAQSSIDRAFELAWADATVELRHLGISAAQSHRFQRLLTAVLFPQANLRATIAADALRGEGRHVLWSLGLSGDLPLVIARIDESEPGELCRELLLAHEFFRLNNQQLELLLLNEEPAGYLQPVQDLTLGLVHARLAHAQLDQRGGVFVRRASHLAPQERSLLLAAARVVLPVSQGALARQLRRATERTTALAPVLPWKAAARSRDARIVETPAPLRPELQFDNGTGGFSQDGREYVMVIARGRRPPAPWCNAIANAQFGTVVSESGSGFTWSQNSQRHRLTAWSNDPICDPSGEVIYLRDDDDGRVWSATPAPAGGAAEYLVRHGQGYSVFAHTRDRLAHELTISVDAERPVKLFRLVVRNLGERTRTLSVFGFIDWVLGSHRDQSRVCVATRWEPADNALVASNCFSAFAHRHAFLSATEAPRSVSCDRDEFLGVHGSSARPRGLERTVLSGRSGFGLEPCAAMQHTLVLAPGESHELGFALGEGESLEAALALASSLRDAAQLRAAIDRARTAWDELLGCVQVQTSDRALDLLLNRFLPYQVLGCRVWARSAFYQSGGAYGFRDQLQDVLALLHMRPDVAREHILRCAARQFSQGDVQHWWHPETGEGVRTHCSDDMLWLPFATAEYVRVTGDRAVLDESIPFLEERKLEPGDHDVYSVPRVGTDRASLYEHCLRALDAGLTAGEHGLPLMRGGDWNDGMDRVGALGKGESVWLGFFLVRVLADVAELARMRGDTERAQTSLRAREQLSVALEAHAWDGAWYRRAFCDDGSLLGSVQSPECRIDAIAQSWAVLAGCARPARAAQALAQAERQLIRDDMMLLLTPPFAGAIADPGYIRAYPAGVRENGGQYTHGALWTVQALAVSGEQERAHALLSLLNPIHHALDAAAVERYAIEPYVVAADVYSAPGLVGRGGWSWYTGAAGWMYRIALEHMLGFSVRDGQVCIANERPAAFDRYRIRYGHGEHALEIEVDRAGAGVAAGAWLDGRPVSADAVRIPQDARTHSLKIVSPSLAPAALRAASS